MSNVDRISVYVAAAAAANASWANQRPSDEEITAAGFPRNFAPDALASIDSRINQVREVRLA